MKNKSDIPTSCNDCGSSLKDGYVGEEVIIKRIFKPDKKVWIYRCHNCDRQKFIKMVNSDPRLKARYWDIHGKSPEEVFKDFEN